MDTEKKVDWYKYSTDLGIIAALTDEALKEDNDEYDIVDKINEVAAIIEEQQELTFIHLRKFIEYGWTTNLEQQTEVPEVIDFYHPNASWKGATLYSHGLIVDCDGNHITTRKQFDQYLNRIGKLSWFQLFKRKLFKYLGGFFNIMFWPVFLISVYYLSR